MAWTELTPPQHARTGGKYASDLTDAKSAVISPLMPPIRTTNLPRTTRLHDVFDTILYMATTRCRWRILPDDFLPVSTVRGYFYACCNDGLLDEMNRKLAEVGRTLAWLEGCLRLSKDWEKLSPEHRHGRLYPTLDALPAILHGYENARLVLHQTLSSTWVKVAFRTTLFFDILHLTQARGSRLL